MVTTVLSSLADSSSTPSIAFACANGVACFTPRLLYDTILNKLAKYTPVWEAGSQLWGADSGQRWNDSVDAFIHGLKTFVSEFPKNRTSSVSGENDKDAFEGPRIVILIERAERLKTSLPDLIVPLTRLSELVSA
jgi:origin recognition complex subunit 5